MFSLESMSFNQGKGRNKETSTKASYFYKLLSSVDCMMSDASYALDSSESVFHLKLNTVLEFINKFHRSKQYKF